MTTIHYMTASVHIPSDPSVSGKFVNVLGGITASDTVVHGITHRWRLRKAEGGSVDKPIVIPPG